ncbi:MAG: hypoxanthine phosphoribosyltransferase [Fusobacterium sp.]|uniref:hypoxanthine phosphoribosyltransferase n=1 Tax=Fusobacterium sp. SB021 TaxID=2744227 RepID=UPI003A36046B
MEGIVEVLISREKVEERIKELAKEIEKDYAGKELVCVGLLKGSVMFMADLIKAVDLDLRIDFMKVSSYGSGTNSTGVVKILKDVDVDLAGKDVLIVEDIIDTGLTILNVKDFLSKKNPNSVRVCTLLDKPSRRVVEVKGEYVGFEIPDEFVVGYGLDLDEKYRNLPFVGRFVRK